MILVLGRNEVDYLDSILNSIKKFLMITEAQTEFDDIIIMHINSVFDILLDLGVGPVNGFSISDSNDSWETYVLFDTTKSNLVKSYMQLKVKLLFDPPTNTSLLESMKQQIIEFEGRLRISAENNNME